MLARGRFPPAREVRLPATFAFSVVCFVIAQRLSLVCLLFAIWLITCEAHAILHLTSAFLSFDFPSQPSPLLRQPVRAFFLTLAKSWME